MDNRLTLRSCVCVMGSLILECKALDTDERHCDLLKVTVLVQESTSIRETEFWQSFDCSANELTRDEKFLPKIPIPKNPL